jgi:hypothetical protein
VTHPDFNLRSSARGGLQHRYGTDGADEERDRWAGYDHGLGMAL